MKKYFKLIIKKSIILICTIMTLITSLLPNTVFADSVQGTITGNEVRFRSGAGTNYTSYGDLNKNTVVTVISTTKYSGTGCSNGWYQIYYNDKTGYVCSDYVYIAGYDAYDRPWTSPKKAIVGGAKFMSENYISKGQYNSYLKKFNVNPNGYYNVYTHQYMYNVRAPYQEAKTSYNSYVSNNLLGLPLVFSIPVYNNMPEITTLYNYTTQSWGQDNVTDSNFEASLDAQGFPESYKRKLREIHNKYPNWIFEAMHTELDFSTAVNTEKRISSIDSTNSAYIDSDQGTYKESGWYLVNYDCAAYFMDPRNSLQEDRILQFEKLSYSEYHTESTINSVLKGTFMADYSFLDNQTYASIFLEAGRTANMNAVYLAALARQESGANISSATNGARFEYQGITYEGFYNFFNIGASSSAENPSKAGLVYASKGAVVNAEGIIMGNITGNIVDTSVTGIINKLGTSTNGSYMHNISLGTTVKTLLAKASGDNVVIRNSSGTQLTGDELLATGMTITINSSTYTIIIYGDLSGDGQINSADLLKMRQHLLGSSTLNGAYLEAGKVQSRGGTMNSADLLLLRKHLLGTATINQG